MRFVIIDGEVLNKLWLSFLLSPWLGFKVLRGRKKLITGNENERMKNID